VPEYADKSIEELRLEDYQAKRKVPKQRTNFSFRSFAATVMSPVVGFNNRPPSLLESPETGGPSGLNIGASPDLFGQSFAISETAVRQSKTSSSSIPVAPDNGSHLEEIPIPGNPTIVGISSSKIGGVNLVVLQFPNKQTMDLIPLQTANNLYPIDAK
jgi:hypothetical protein